METMATENNLTKIDHVSTCAAIRMHTTNGWSIGDWGEVLRAEERGDIGLGKTCRLLGNTPLLLLLPRFASYVLTLSTTLGAVRRGRRRGVRLTVVEVLTLKLNIRRDICICPFYFISGSIPLALLSGGQLLQICTFSFVSFGIWGGIERHRAYMFRRI